MYHRAIIDTASSQQKFRKDFCRRTETVSFLALTDRITPEINKKGSPKLSFICFCVPAVPDLLRAVSSGPWILESLPLKRSSQLGCWRPELNSAIKWYVPDVICNQTICLTHSLSPCKWKTAYILKCFT